LLVVFEVDRAGLFGRFRRVISNAF